MNFIKLWKALCAKQLKQKSSSAIPERFLVSESKVPTTQVKVSIFVETMLNILGILKQPDLNGPKEFKSLKNNREIFYAQNIKNSVKTVIDSH